MFSITARRVTACLAVLGAIAVCLPQVLAQSPAGPATRPSLEMFFGNSPFSGAVLSPDGKSLAVTVSPKDKRKGLYVIDLVTNKGSIVAQFSDADVSQVQWVNNERILFDTADSTLNQRTMNDGPGLFAVNRDGENMRQLVAFGEDYYGSKAARAEKNLLPWNHFMMNQPGAQDSDEVYVIRPQYEVDGTTRHVELVRLHTISGANRLVKRPPHTRQWLLDLKGQPRVAVGHHNNDTFVYYRDSADGEWATISRGDLLGIKKRSFAPLAFGPNNTLYVQDFDGDMQAVFTFDYKTGKLSDKPIINTAGYDFNGTFIANSEKVLGMEFSTDARSTLWFDPKMKALQERVDGLLKSTVNIISVAARSELPWVLVESYSDVQPAVWNLFNTETGAFQLIGESRPGIDPTQMATQQQITFKARDGLTVPALLTLPKGGGKNLPMVVLVHGGPWVRGSLWGWDAESQFLASRGYVVIEPAFRGTTGFGDKHYRAGWKQWGLAMQDDVADSVKWAISQGYADANRVCIAGASYGGYATLMGLIKHPELYKCGVNWVGVSDFELFVDGHWSFKSDMDQTNREFTLPELVGDLKKDAEQLRATSPLANASKLKRPLLMAYGGLDRRVPRFHGDKFYAAVKPTNPDVELIVYPEEGHGWVLPKTRNDFYGRMEAFLERHIGKP